MRSLEKDRGRRYETATGLAEDLCLAMRAESILIERMAGKSTVGIQVPNHDRETIWLRDVIEAFGLTPLFLPDISGSLDGHVPEEFTPTTLGGIEVTARD